jgi:hypothetical protein
MLLLTGPHGRCVIVDRGKLDRAATARIEKALGTPVDTLTIAGLEGGSIRLADVERRVKSVNEVIRQDELQSLEFQAYHFVDALKERAQGSRRYDLIAVYYHEWASFIFAAFRVLTLVQRVLEPTLILVDAATVNAFRKYGTPFRSVKIQEVVQAAAPTRLARLRSRLRATRRRVRRRIGKIREKIDALKTKLDRIQSAASRFVRAPTSVFTRGFSDLRYLAGHKAFKGLRKLWHLLNWVVALLLLGLAAPIKLLRTWSRNSRVIRLMRDAVDAVPVVVISVQDSGTRVNLDPALSIVSGLRSHGVVPLIVTESRFVAHEFTKSDVAVLDFAGFGNWLPVWGRRPQPEILPAGQFPADEEVRRLANAVVDVHWKRLHSRLRQFEYLMRKFEQSVSFLAVLSINETLPICVAAGLWAQRRGRPWIGHFPILLGRRPDCYFFPADLHLAYGDQLSEHMVRSGVPSQSIAVVGSYTYDKHRGRDKEADRRLVELKFPRAAKKRLIVVATEALPDCETELVPILSTAAALPGAHLILKLHPEDSLEYFESLAARVGVHRQIDIVKSYPLGALLDAADLLICVMSNIAIEAAVMGTPTLMCDFSDKTKVIDFAEEGLCVACRDPAMLKPMLEQLLFDEVKSVELHARLAQGIRRFNGPNDGRSTERIVDRVLAAVGSR